MGKCAQTKQIRVNITPGPTLAANAKRQISAKNAFYSAGCLFAGKLKKWLRDKRINYVASRVFGVEF